MINVETIHVLFLSKGGAWMDVISFPISSEYITLGQFLKLADIINSGGMAKPFLEEYVVLVNGKEESRRGKKLYPGDTVEFPESTQFNIISEEELKL